jgi:hypothetical protein
MRIPLQIQAWEINERNVQILLSWVPCVLLSEPSVIFDYLGMKNSSAVQFIFLARGRN